MHVIFIESSMICRKLSRSHVFRYIFACLVLAFNTEYEYRSTRQIVLKTSVPACNKWYLFGCTSVVDSSVVNKMLTGFFERLWKAKSEWKTNFFAFARLGIENDEHEFCHPVNRVVHQTPVFTFPVSLNDYSENKVARYGKVARTRRHRTVETRY